MKISTVVGCFLFAVSSGLVLAKEPLLTEGCSSCVPEECAKVSRGRCPSKEVTIDECGCCHVCSSGLGTRCGGYRWEHGICGKKMFCAGFALNFQARIMHGEAGTCVCIEQNSVCGSDGEVYEDVCHLHDVNKQRKSKKQKKIKETKMRNCGAAPTITNGPADVQTSEESQFYLFCEAKGLPIPEIEWTRDGKKLPSDHENVSVQVRGGPMKNCLSSWVFVGPVEMKDAGEYRCIAKNNQGEVVQAAQVTLR